MIHLRFRLPEYAATMDVLAVQPSDLLLERDASVKVCHSLGLVVCICSRVQSVCSSLLFFCSAFKAQSQNCDVQLRQQLALHILSGGAPPLVHVCFNLKADMSQL